MNREEYIKNEYVGKEYEKFPPNFQYIDRIARGEHLYYIRPDSLGIGTQNKTGGGTIWHIMDIYDFLEKSDRAT